MDLDYREQYPILITYFRNHYLALAVACAIHVVSPWERSGNYKNVIKAEATWGWSFGELTTEMWHDFFSSL